MYMDMVRLFMLHEAEANAIRKKFNCFGAFPYLAEGRHTKQQIYVLSITSLRSKNMRLASSNISSLISIRCVLQLAEHAVMIQTGMVIFLGRQRSESRER